MRLSDRSQAALHITARLSLSAWWTSLIVVAGLLVVFVLDRNIESAPVQHLYYLPIVLASLRLGRLGGFLTSAMAIALYHEANPSLWSTGYHELDIIQIALFVLAAAVTTRLAHDTRRMRELATTDDLTGLHNLRSFEAELIRLVRASRANGTPLTMLVLDVDRLKRLNDTYGHLAGAEAVRTVGRTLAERLPSDAVACRYGGDEFAIVVPACNGSRAAAIADELRATVHEQSPVLAGLPFAAGTLSISIGLASLPAPHGPIAYATDSDAGEALFRAADRALYAAKDQGRNRVSVA